MKKAYFLPIIIVALIILFKRGNSLEQRIVKEKVPKSVAIIMDGNRRWGSKNNLTVAEAHYQGAKNVEKILKAALRIGIKEITIFAFSNENWKRSKEEINSLMSLFERFLKESRPDLLKNRAKVKFLGRLGAFSKKLRDEITKIEKETADGIYKLNICLNYGGRTEILDAVNKIVEDNIENIDEETFKGYLYSKEMSDPDLIIRTGGEYRVSNFLLWQLAYSELYFSTRYWPDFNENDFFKAILEFQRRKRTFGGDYAK